MSSSRTTSRRRNRSGRTSCSISTSPAASPAPRGRCDDVTVIEVGPGPGGLTRALLAEGARKVVAIERDERCLAALAEIARALSRAASKSSPATRWRPTTPRSRASMPTAARAHRRQPALQHRHAAAGELAREPRNGRRSGISMTLMFQREVAERIVATPRRARRLRPPRRAVRLAHARAHPLRRAAVRLHAAAEGDLVGRGAHAARKAPALRLAKRSRASRRPPSASAARCCGNR